MIQTLDFLAACFAVPFCGWYHNCQKQTTALNICCLRVMNRSQQ